MGLAFAVSKRSHDEETQHGCILCDEYHRPLSFGYNGLPRGANDMKLPTKRPEKYPWMYHAERNALANCLLRPEQSTAFVTGKCCNDCIYALWQHGVNTVYIANKHGTYHQTESDDIWFAEFIKEVGMTVRYVKPNLSWILDLGKEVTKENFYS